MLKGKEDGEEVTSPMKGVQVVEKRANPVRGELFPSPPRDQNLSLQVHGRGKQMSKGNSAMQDELEARGEQGNGQRKFKRHTREGQKKSVPTKSPKGQCRKRRGDEGLLVAPAVNQDAKKAKHGGSEEAVKVIVSVDAGLSEQPCEAQ